MRRVLTALGVLVIAMGALATTYQVGARQAVQVEIDGRDYGPATSIEYTPGQLLRVETEAGPQCVFLDGFETEVEA